MKLAFAPIKQFEYSWLPVSGADHYQLIEKASPTEAYTLLAAGIVGYAASYTMPLHRRWQSTYIVEACPSNTDEDCIPSKEVNVVDDLVAAIGYIKSSNPSAKAEFGYDVALSGDGTRLAVGAKGENGYAGAAYVFSVSDDGWRQERYFTAVDSAPLADFGFRVTLSWEGDVLAVSSPSSDGIINNAGSVYLYSRNGRTWSHDAILTSPSPEENGYFGADVAIAADGQILVIGAYGEGDDGGGMEPGMAHVFQRKDLFWQSSQTLMGSNTENDDRFGYSVAIARDGSTIAVGAPYEQSSLKVISAGPDEMSDEDIVPSMYGAVYIFTRNDEGPDGVWLQDVYIKTPNSDSDEQFGTDVALSESGDVLVAGAIGTNASSGAAYIVSRSRDIWSVSAFLTASSANGAVSFGRTVAVSDDGSTVAIGARAENGYQFGVGSTENLPIDPVSNESGAAFLYIQIGDRWIEGAYIKASNAEAGDHFGQGVALSGDATLLAIGAADEDSASKGIQGDQSSDPDKAYDAGAVYLY